MLKYELIPQQLLREGIIQAGDVHSPGKANEDVILATHQQGYWQRVRDLTLSAAEVRRIGFPLSRELVERELRIAQGTVNGCLHALNHGIAFNVAGGTHHAGYDWGEGFCLLNDQAIAANYLLENGLAKKILIIDLDVHQGNGTAALFSEEERVFTFSMHAESNFPFRKEKSDLDIGLEDQTNGEEYLKLLNKHLPVVVSGFQPDFIFYLSGVDVLSTDKLGKLNLSLQECMERDQVVLKLCHKSAIPVQISMGGGYSPKIGDIVDAHCNTFRVSRDLYF
ncbi:MAG: histone deacetylase [Bacteroidota bacterium]